MRFLLLFAPKHLIFSWNRPVFLQNALFKKKKIWYNIRKSVYYTELKSASASPTIRSRQPTEMHEQYRRFLVGIRLGTVLLREDKNASRLWYNNFQEGILSGLRRRFIHPWEFPLPPFFTRVSCRVTWHSERCRV